MVALLGFFEKTQMLFQSLFGGPCRTIDTLKHLVFLIAAPIGSGDSGELEGFNGSSGRHMRTTAKIHPVPLAVERHNFVGYILDDSDLVVLAHAAEQLDGLTSRHLFASYLEIGLSNFLHSRFDLFNLFRSEGSVSFEIVIKPVLDGGSYGHLSSRE